MAEAKEQLGAAECRWEIGLCGTFDVENYGDLLFPLIAQRELTARLGAVNLHPFSYHAKSAESWPYDVESVADLPEVIQRLDGMLIGGGHLIRFDKEVAPGYLPSDPEKIHHPTGYWLTPALIAAQHGVPLIWNAPGLHDAAIPEWSKPLLEAALNSSRYIAMRSERSRIELEPLTSTPITVVPDTAFGLPRLMNPEAEPPSDAFKRLCEAHGLRSPYLVFQARLGQDGVLRFMRDHAARFRDFQIVVVAMGPSLDEHPQLIETEVPNLIRISEWPRPLVMAELIGRAEAVVGRSFHLMITALVYGVPVFTRQDLSKGKYQDLQAFETICKLPPNRELDADWILARVGRKVPSARARAAGERLAGHWDRIADELRAGAKQSKEAALDQFWQRLPNYLEQAAGHSNGAATPARRAPEPDVMEDRLDAVRRELDVARLELKEANAQLTMRDAGIDEMNETIRDLLDTIRALNTSRSWKLTAPVRAMGRLFR